MPGAGRRNAGVNSPTQPAAPTRRWSAQPASSAPRSRSLPPTKADGPHLTSRVDLPGTARTLHLSMVASIDIAYVVRDTAADHSGLTAPARIIGMRSQGEAEIAIEQGETRYEGVTWTTRHQIAANRLIPLPEPGQTGTDQPRRRGHRHHKPSCRRGRPGRPRQPHAINQIRSSNRPQTLIRVPSDHPPTKSSAKRPRR